MQETERLKLEIQQLNDEIKNLRLREDTETLNTQAANANQSVRMVMHLMSRFHFVMRCNEINFLSDE